MQKTNIKNVLMQALNPKRLPVMLKKVKKRLIDERGLLSKHENLEWIRSQCSGIEALASELNPELWEEAKEFGVRLNDDAERILRNVGYDLGGGGMYPFLYFLTRLTKPECIVETGVGAGYSSCAFLSAIRANGKGRLYSSDFPYFRLPHPERYIGVLVEEGLKANWELYIEGDEANLPRILERMNRIDIFHYDSDKSFSGRQGALSMIEGRLSRNGIILMDDIQDNSFFHDYVVNQRISACSIHEFEGKYVGMIGQPTKGRT